MMKWKQIPITILVMMTGCYVGPTSSGAFPDWIVNREMESPYVDAEFGIGIADSRPEALYNAFLNLLHRESGYYLVVPHLGRTATIGTVSATMGLLYITEKGTVGEDTLYSSKGSLTYDPRYQPVLVQNAYDAFMELMEQQSETKTEEADAEVREPYFRIDCEIKAYKREGNRADQPGVVKVLSVTKNDVTLETLLRVLKEDEKIIIEEYYGPVPDAPTGYSYHGARVIVPRSLLHEGIRSSATKVQEELIEQFKEQNLEYRQWLMEQLEKQPKDEDNH